MGLLDGKVAIITGAGGGIGRAHALLFAREGAKVVVNDLGGARDGSGTGSTMAEKVVAEIVAAGGQATPNFDDVSEREGAERIVKTALDSYGQLDILVNNAGILRDKTLLKMDDAMFDLVIKVHLRGTYLCTQVAARHMAERGKGGRIINTSSVSGMMGNFGQANYSSAKAGIYGLTRTASMELAKFSITVNALAPVALTRLTEDLMMFKALPNATELLAPEHVAPAALFLASELGAGVTGTVLAVEGPRVYLYKMTQTEGVMPRDGQAWSAQEIKDRWSEI
ncbi:MAG: SDR family NAD(P)-dependent oxidoreductase, partial [Myxococcales bacterium]|nr:SDR family NAD(P)-dependent oxidoreductase [Myxococcales bacterium]